MKTTITSYMVKLMITFKIVILTSIVFVSSSYVLNDGAAGVYSGVSSVEHSIEYGTDGICIPLPLNIIIQNSACIKSL